MKFLFVVQGEGRGHMTQAISLFRMLQKNNHEICHVIVGKSKRRMLPSFFSTQIDGPISQLESPNFVTDKNNTSVNLFKTLVVNLAKIKTYAKSLQQLDQLVKTENPDVIVNFYDFLCGLYYLTKRPRARHVCLAHQFLLNHSSFMFPKGRFLAKLLIKMGNRLAGFGAEKILCLSFKYLDDEPKKKRFVVPPLLREEIKSQQIQHGDYFLVYMVNDGYSVQVEKFHLKNPDIPIHCFWDKKDVPETYQKDKTLTFHQLDDRKFIKMMASCKGYLTTAGFESVCEAMYMGKPVLMVPVKGHYEQACNAEDAKKIGGGVSSEFFDLEILLNYLPQHIPVQADFREWCKQAETRFSKNLMEHVN